MKIVKKIIKPESITGLYTFNKTNLENLKNSQYLGIVVEDGKSNWAYRLPLKYATIKIVCGAIQIYYDFHVDMKYYVFDLSTKENRLLDFVEFENLFKNAFF